MSVVSQILPPPILTDEVHTFAAERGVSVYLAPLVALTRQLFPQSRICVEVREDPELSYNTQIHFDVDSTGLSAEEMLRLERQWLAESSRICPPTLIHLFNLLLWPRA